MNSRHDEERESLLRAHDQDTLDSEISRNGAGATDRDSELEREHYLDLDPQIRMTDNRTMSSSQLIPDAGHLETASDHSNIKTSRQNEVITDATTDSSDLDDEPLHKRSCLPYPVRRIFRAIATWTKGPPNAQPYLIRPLLPSIQEYPLYLVDRFLPKARHRHWLLMFYFAVYIVLFCVIKRQGAISSEVDGWGAPQDIDCGDTYWGYDNSCGIDGSICRPFTNTGFAFRCAANCASFQVLNPRAVGDQEIVYQPLVVGGPGSDGNSVNATYRGDSYLCSAAIHAGVINNQNGGCGVVELIGRHQNFLSSESNGIKSIGFESYFPLSFRFVDGVECTATDPRWSLLGLTVAFTTVLSILTDSPAAFFFPNFVGIFWTVGMALDSPKSNSIADLFCTILGKFLPAIFVAWAMFDRMGIRRTLNGLTAQLEKTILWLGPCWVGAMDNYTLSFIPIQRLNKHDLDQQPGARAALAVIIVVITAIVATQLWFFRQEGRLLTSLKLYSVLLVGMVIAMVLPGVDFRLHHYILALVLLPATSLQTRPSLVYQGLLIGLFINGIARWNFDSVLQTPDSLRGDAQLGTGIPTILSPNISLSKSVDKLSNISFRWDPPSNPIFDGISVLVNDVEKFRTYFADVVGHQSKFKWTRNQTLDLPEYFRFGYMQGSLSADYSKAGIWTAEGDWVEMQPGPSRIKAREWSEYEATNVLRR